MKKQKNKVGRIIKILLITSGSIFITLCILAFTTLPFWAYYNLGTKNCEINQPPSIIVVLSGSGIPSADALLKSFYTARMAFANPSAKIVIAMPGNISDSASDPRQFATDLMMRGVKKESISFENSGRNTREQALKISEGKTIHQLNQAVLLVTTPEHMRRAALAFRKCGYTNVSGLPTFEFPLNADLSFKENDLSGNKFLPSIGKNLQVRYQFWNHLKYEVLVTREYFALSYYKLRGWI